MNSIEMASQAQLLSVIQTQTEIAKLGLDIDAVMRLVTIRAQQLTQAVGAVIELQQGDEMVYRAVSGAARDLLGFSLKSSHSLSGTCIRQREALYCEDSEIDHRVDREACRYVGLRSMAVVPLLHANEAIGVLKIYSDRPNAFQRGDLHLISLMSELVAAAMYHATRFGTQELYRLATHDELTGLANRSLFLQCLHQGIEKAKFEKQALIVIVLDMDGLKQINDRFGHRLGDAALNEIAKRILKNTGQSDVVARLGGDEFAVILSSEQHRHLATLTMQRIVDACALAFNIEDRALNIGLSAGLAIYPEDATELQRLMDVADLRMYQHKQQRKQQLSLG